MRSIIVVSLLSLWLLSGCVVALAGVGAGIGYAVMKGTKDAQNEADITAREEPAIHPVTQRVTNNEARMVPPPHLKSESSPDVRYIYPEGYFKRESAP